MIQIIVVEELGTLNPAAGRVVCGQEAEPRLLHRVVLKIEDEDGSDLAIR